MPGKTNDHPLKPLEDGMVSLTDIIAPSSIEIDFKSIRIGDIFYRTYFIVDYPRYVSSNWLQPVIDFENSLDISMFIYPSSSSDILSDLKRKIAEMEATISSQADNGEAYDPKINATLEDAMVLQEELARGLERFFNSDYISQYPQEPFLN